MGVTYFIIVLCVGCVCVCRCDVCFFFNYCITMDFESVNKRFVNRSRWLHLQLNNLTVSRYLRSFLMNTCPTDNK